MRDFTSLKFLDKFQSVFEKFGIEYPLLRKILWLKLLMDSRRVPTVANNYKEDDKDTNLFLRSLIPYALMGMMVMFLILSNFPIFIKMNICIGIIIFMVMSSMVADFSSVLLDVKDKNILMTKPIDTKVINLAKIIHITIYLSTITAVISGPSLVAGTFKHGIVFFLIFLYTLVVSTGFIIFITTLLYFLILKFYDGEKLKDIINYFQIILSIVMIVGYQLVGRLYDVLDFDIIVHPKPWMYLLPSAWFSAPFHLFLGDNVEPFYVLLSILSIIIPAVTFVIHVKFVLPYFENYLSKLNNNKEPHKFKKSISISRTIGQLICFNQVERSFYNFTHMMLSKERKTKLQIYPTLSMSLVLPFIIIFNYGINKDFTNTSFYFFIYLTIWFLVLSINVVFCSENYKGWRITFYRRKIPKFFERVTSDTSD